MRLREEANGYLRSLGRTVKRKIKRIRRRGSYDVEEREQ
jgi:hypothetical protein